MNLGAILAQFNKKLDVNTLFKLLIDPHLTVDGFHKKTNARSLAFS